MVIGEVVPKNLAMERCERLALAVAPPLQLFSRVTGLFVSLVERTSAGVSRLLGLKMDHSQQGYTAEELKLLFSVSKREGRLARFQEQMLSRAVDFPDVTVREVMVPRQEMVALPSDAGLDQVIDCIARHQHSRVPIYEDSPEHVVGVLYAKQVWSFVQQMRRWSMLDRPEPVFRMGAGRPKFVERVAQVTFSAKNARLGGQEVLYVTEAAVFRLTDKGPRLEEAAPGIDLERDLFPRLGFRPLLAEPVKTMAPELFRDELLPAELFPNYRG